MKMLKTILMFILLFTGYLCEDTDVTEDAVPFSYHSSTTTKVPQNPKSETTEHKSHEVPGLVPDKRLSTLLVAGISISSVFVFLLVIAGWYAMKKSKERSAEINSVACSEPGVFLRRISMHENQREWRFEGSLQ